VIRSIAIQIVVFVVIFNVLSWFRATSMLSTDTKLSHEPQVLTTLMDDEIQLRANGKETILYFFAPWCSICHFSMDNLEEFYLENQDINVIAVALDYTEISEIRDFTKQHQLTFPIALGNEQVKRQFNVSGYPSYYVIDENNVVTEKSLGYSSKIGMYLRTL